MISSTIDLIVKATSIRNVLWLTVVVALMNFSGSHAAAATTFQEAERFFQSGQYEKCAEICQSEVDQRTWNSRWTLLLIRCKLQVGQYEEALSAYETGLERFGDDLRIRLLGRDVYRMNDRPVDAKKQIDQITELVQRMPWRYNGSEDLVALGKLLVLQGEDARQVLELCYDRALKQNPANLEALAASTVLALDKADYAVAASTIEKAVKLQPENAEWHYLKARAWAETDSEQSELALRRSIELNPRLTDSLLMAAEGQIDAEKFDEAEAIIEQALAVNSRLPRAWALRAVIAHLRGQYEVEGEHRKEALKPWKLNPEVDFIIGTKLSRHYRFEDAVLAHQRSLQMDAEYQPSMFALAQDLLRLGRTEEGWNLLTAVRSNDQYNVVAFNLSQLKEQLDKFTVLEAPGLVVRMEAREAEVYGAAVIDLLSQARAKLTAKYHTELNEPVYVEIFHRQQDFAIRTFGLPGGAGYLGVCFGRLITANSPATGGENPTNWQSVLWHEYCHVVTLQKSKNRMPRWLSEGISVYEERLQNETWGQPMDRHYRQMILSNDFTAMSDLSSAFLSPKSGMHLQFAYFESSLAVQFLIEQYSFDSLLRVLDDLGQGLPINAALERLTGSLTVLDEQFKGFAETQAKAYAPTGDWTELIDRQPRENVAAAAAESAESLQPESVSIEFIKDFLKEHPASPLALRAIAEYSLANQQYSDAKDYLLRLQAIEPEDADANGLYAMLAKTYAELQEDEKEVESLQKLIQICPNPLVAIERLIKLEQNNGDWSAVDALAAKYLAVQPMKATPHEWVVASAHAQDTIQSAKQSLNALLQLKPLDPAEIHFQLARAYEESDKAKAKRHVLQSLELAPRYFEALRLLDKLVDDSTDAANDGNESQLGL